MLKVKTETFAVHIPYVSSPLAIMAILQGDVQFACVPAVAVLPQVKAGKMRALAVSTAKRSQFLPDVPTMKEAGLSGIESVAWMAIMAPASTANDIVARMNQEINTVLAMPEVKEKLYEAMLHMRFACSSATQDVCSSSDILQVPVHWAPG